MKTYLKFLSRNKLYTAIEFVGLSVALAFVIISFCYVVQQYAVTRENPDRERIYAVGSDDMVNCYAMKEFIDGKLPEVENVTHFLYRKGNVVKVGDGRILVNVLACDREFFDFFPVTFKDGNADNFTNAHIAFVSEKVAAQIEGEVVGSQIIVSNDTLNVVGVFSDLGTSLIPQTDIIGNIETSRLTDPYRQQPTDMWTNILTFVKVGPNIDVVQLKEKLNSICREQYGEQYPFFLKDEGLSMLRMDKLFFSDVKTGLQKGDKSMLRAVIVVGLLLLISALINYINLNVALTGKRAKERASRRLLGAQKSDIVLKFLGESLFFTFCCFAVGLLLAYLFVPSVNRMLDASVAVKIPFTWGYLAAYGLMVVVVAFLAGILPAVIISQTRPIDVVKGSFRLRSRKGMMRFFIVFQNAISIVLIALTITMELQMHYMVERPMGLDMDNLFFINSKVNLTTKSEAFREELRSLPCVNELAMSNNVPGISSTAIGMKKKGETEHNAMVNLFECDTVAFRLLGFQVVEKFHEPEKGSGWMTESTVVGLTGLPYGVYDYDTIKSSVFNDICGVIKDFNMLDALHAADEDYTIVFGNNGMGYSKIAHLLLEIVGDHDEARRAIDAVYKKHSEEFFGSYVEPDYYGFVKDVVASKYDKIRHQMRLIEIIMAVAVLLSLLGLVAISTHFASEREKTIAIRKVFGGTMESEIRRNLKEYVIMILIANAIAIPVAVWLCQRYLEDFAYRIDLHPWIFVATVALSFVIAIGSVLWQIVSVARVNPVTALKKE